MSYPHGAPIRTRSIAEIYSGKLHSYSPLYHPPYDPYRQHTGILSFLRKQLEHSAEQQHAKGEAERKKEKLEKEKREIERKKKEIEINKEDDLEF